jgi:hypothetical protein
LNIITCFQYLASIESSLLQHLASIWKQVPVSSCKSNLFWPHSARTHVHLFAPLLITGRVALNLNIARRLLLVWHVGTRCVPDDCCRFWHKMCARRLRCKRTNIILVVFKADLILVIFKADIVDEWRVLRSSHTNLASRCMLSTSEMFGSQQHRNCVKLSSRP